MDDSARVPVVADHRERNSTLLPMLASDPRVDLQTTVLPTGDYLLDGHVLVERKTLPDLEASLRDGRLFRQASRLVDAPYPRVALLLEGTGKDLAGTQIRREAVQGAIE